MRCAITGGMGFIGSVLARRLLAAGHQVVLIDSLTEQIHGPDPDVVVPEGAAFIHGDVRDLADNPDWIDGCEAVYHLAAETGTAQSMYRIRHYVDVNEGGTAALLEAIGQCAQRPKVVVLASSRSVYGEGAYRSHDGSIVQPEPRSREQLDSAQWDPRDEFGRPLEPIATPETLGFAPGSVYAATKASQELLLASAAEALGFRSVVLRFQNVYGEGQSLQNPYTGIISIFFNRARQGMMLPIYEDGLETRDFVHVKDIARALEAALAENVPSGVVCNIGAGKATTVQDLARGLCDAAGFSVPIETTGQFRVGDIRHNWAAMENAARYLDFVPTISLEDGLKRFCQWAESQPVFADGLDKATAELKKKGLAN